jgi:tetratricopeptide (TPR) repeat protein
MKFFFTAGVIALLCFCSCTSNSPRITRAEDYDRYLKLKSPSFLRSLQNIDTDISFWSQRLKKIPLDLVSRVKLASLYASRFKIAGDIQNIHTSDSLYLLANPLIKIGSSSVYKALAANCITQHKFRQAKLYVDTALHMGDGKYTSLLMQCDVSIELGDLLLARKSLADITDKNDFDYLIREAKLLDHEGDLSQAIKKMEKAVNQVQASNNDKLFAWAETNLGDMYGHGNRFSDAYQCYLAVLKKNPEDLYALKGIAWLAFSHDKNVNEAKRILNYLSKVHPVPDYDLILAQIADYEHDQTRKDKLQAKFLGEVANPLYGDMYNKYVFYLTSDESRDINKALWIAEREVNNRPTPQSFDLLAWAKFQSGYKDEALNIESRFVENKNFEPDAFFHMGMIYASTGEISKGKKYLKRARSSSFELGPTKSEQIANALHNL